MESSNGEFSWTLQQPIIRSAVEGSPEQIIPSLSLRQPNEIPPLR